MAETAESSTNILVHEQYKAQYLANREELLQLFDLSESWKLLKEKDGVSVHMQQYKDYKVQVARISTIFDAPIDETAQLLFNDAEELLKSKPTLESARIIAEYEEKGRVIQVCTKPILFVAGREVLVYANTEKLSSSQILQVQVGIDSHDLAPLPDKLVRSTTILAGHLLTSQTNPLKTQVSYIILNLLNGNIPYKLNESVVFQHLDSYVYFKNLCAKRRSEKSNEDLQSTV